MPELTLIVKWPDEEVQNIYSPSTIIKKYFKVGEKLSVLKFLEKSTKAFNHASKRVEEKHGFNCAASLASIHAIQQKAGELKDIGSDVEIINFC